MKSIVTRSIWLQEPQLWLLFLLSGLYSIYLTLVWRFENPSHLGISLLFGAVALLFLHEKHQQFKFVTSLGASGVGTVLVLGVLWYTTQSDPPLLRTLPFVSALGVGLLASGFRGLKQYRRELIIFFCLGGPSLMASLWFDLSPITAGFARLLLYYTGFPVSGEGLIVRLPTGSIKVGYDCSGMDQINYLLGLSVLCLMMFPIRSWIRQILVLAVGITLGFLINAIRVAILTVLIASNRNTFDHLHTGEGSYLFAMIAIGLLGLFYWWTLKHHEAPPPSTLN